MTKFITIIVFTVVVGIMLTALASITPALLIFPGALLLLVWVIGITIIISSKE